jgi:hypothetical protein
MWSNRFHGTLRNGGSPCRFRLGLRELPHLKAAPAHLAAGADTDKGAAPFDAAL